MPYFGRTGTPGSALNEAKQTQPVMSNSAFRGKSNLLHKMANYNPVAVLFVKSIHKKLLIYSRIKTII